MIFFLRKYKTPYQGIVIGLTLFTLGNSLLSFGSDFIKAIFCSLGWIFMLHSMYKVNTFYWPFKGFARTLFILYMILIVILVFRGYTINYPYQWISTIGAINFHLFAPYYIIPYFLPLLLFIGKNRIEFKTLVHLNYLFNFLFILFFIFNIKTIINQAHLSALGINDVAGYKSLASPTSMFFILVGFFLLCKDFIPKRLWLFNVLVWFLALLTVTIGARRGSMLMLILLGMSALYLHFLSLKGVRKVVSIGFIIFIGLVFIGVYIYSENSIFAYLSSRGLEDTRSNVDEALLAQMSDFQLWFGKGLNGRYYQGNWAVDNLYNGWRYGSETGFFNLVLKGGYVFAFLHILLLLIPALKGLFYSKNSLTKALGIYILLSLIELYPFGWLMFNIKFLIIWIGVVLCWNPRLRGMNNLQIKNEFF